MCNKNKSTSIGASKNVQWLNSGYSIGVSSAAPRDDCAECHSGYGFIHSVNPASKLKQKTGFPQISCAVCHDPHDETLTHQVRKLENVTLQNGVVVSFGGNGVGDRPIQFYSLWGRVDLPAAGQKSAIYKRFDELQAETVVGMEGARMEIDTALWDYAGSVPATGAAVYSAIVPTLYDSTATGGIRWSVLRSQRIRIFP